MGVVEAISLISLFYDVLNSIVVLNTACNVYGNCHRSQTKTTPAKYDPDLKGPTDSLCKVEMHEEEQFRNRALLAAIS